jgi:hypothetical protein
MARWCLPPACAGVDPVALTRGLLLGLSTCLLVGCSHSTPMERAEAFMRLGIANCLYVQGASRPTARPISGRALGTSIVRPSGPPIAAP